MTLRTRSSQVELTWLVAFVCSAVACGGNSTRSSEPSDEPVTDTRGGQRLEAVFLQAADGTGVFRHFYDRTLGLPCRFTAAEPGVHRCLPSDPAGVSVAEIVYADPACTEPHARLFSSSVERCEPPRFALANTTCGRMPQVFELGDASSPATLYRLTDGVCAASSQGTDQLGQHFHVSPVALERFATARLHAGSETGGVVPLELRGDDGARLRTGFRDAREGFDCRLNGPDGDLRCVPVELGLLGYHFADPGCSEPAAALVECNENRDEIAFVQELNGGQTNYYRAGSRLATSYVGRPTSCQPATNGTSAFEVGAAVPLTRFAAGERITVTGTELTVTVDAIAGAALPAYGLMSTAHGGHACHAALGTDGELRCLPAPEGFVRGFFADPECSAPVETSQDELFAVAVVGACPEQVRVHGGLERYSGPVYTLMDGVCTFAHDTPPGDSLRLPYFMYPNEVPAAEFARLSIVTR